MPFNAIKNSKLFQKIDSYKKVLLSIGIALIIIDVLSISYFRIMDRFELVSLDFRYGFKLLFPQKINPDIVIIEIAEDTLGNLGNWPIPRDYHASLVDVLSKYKAKAIAFDILFCESTGWDGVFADAVKRAGNVYFPAGFKLTGKNLKGVIEAEAIDAPVIRALSSVARGVGHINKVVDIDGKVRRVPLFVRFNNTDYSTMALKIADDYSLADTRSMRIPVDENGAVLLNFAGRWADAFKHYSYYDVLASHQELSEGKKPRIDPAAFKDKICFVGLTATGTQELGPIPVESSYPMLGIHANLFNMITERSYIRRLGRTANLAVLIILSALLLLLLRRLKPFMAFFVSIGVIILLFMACILLFLVYGIWIDMACPGVMLFGVYLIITVNRYVGEIKIRERIQKELAVAASIQKCFLPAQVPAVEGLEIAVDMKTAKEVGGDLYDFIKLDGNKFGIMIGDVSGKGVPASLFMARIETLFKVYSKTEAKPSDVLSKLNKELAQDERSGLFTTLVYAVFDTKTKKLIFSDAGHQPMMTVQKGKAEKLSSDDGMALGIMEDATFSDKEIKLAKGDIVVIYTDGISEARDTKANEFGFERLMTLIEHSNHLSAQALLRLIIDEVRQFQGKAVQHDDMTIIVIKAY